MLPVRDYRLGTIVLHDHTDITSQLAVFAGFKGYFGTPADLPLPGAQGYFAIVGSTDTMWVWDMEALPAPAWTDTEAGSGVLSFGPVGFPRLGVVTPQAGDYAANQITNGSNIAGTYVSDALNNLQTRYRTWTIGVTGSGADYECDGTADDVQFNAAIQAMTAGDTLNVLVGTYVTSNTILMDRAINIIGADRSLCIIQATGNYDLFSVTAPGCVFKYIYFVATAAQTSMKALIRLICQYPNPVFATVINNCAFSGNLDIWFDGYNSYTRVSENIFYLCANPLGTTSGLYFAGSANGLSNIVVEKNIGVSTHCLIYSEQYTSIIGMLVSDNYVDAYRPLYFKGGLINSVIRNNYLISGYEAIYIADQDHAASFTTKTSITGNTLSGGSGDTVGMLLYGIQNCVIDGNKFSGYATDCIQLFSTNYPVHCIGNTISNTTVMGTGPTGGITEMSSSQDYNKYVNNICGTVTLAGPHSVDRDDGTYGFVVLTGKPPKDNSGAQVLTVGQWGYWTDGYRYECVASNQIARSAPETNY